MANEKNVSEDALLKALGELEGRAEEYEADDDEQEVVKADESDDSEEDDSDESDSSEGEDSRKSVRNLPGSTDEANGGGFDGEPSAEGEGADEMSIDGEENDPTKSMKSMVEENGDLRKGFEISSFLEALTDVQVEATDGLAKSIADFQAEQRDFNARLQKAVIAIGHKVLDLQKSEAARGEEPVVVRPRSALRKSDVSERFAGNEDGPKYSREQTLEALTNLAIKSEIPPIVVSAYETSGFVDPNYIGQVHGALKAMYG